jgi:Domain of unknown function (DUF4838)/Carbohydrate family 9 binding domain-like
VKSITMKALCAVILMTLAMSAQAQLKAKRGPEMVPFQNTSPWESKALTPVKMSVVDGLAEVVLAENGKAVLPIVIPDRSHPRAVYYRQVAQFLKKYLDAATGGTFDIVTDDKTPERGIFVGPCADAALKPMLKELANFKPEQFMVSAFSKGVLLVGHDRDQMYVKNPKPVRLLDRRASRGTLFAVDDFLERFVGVRFYFPSDVGIYVPYLNTSKVVVPPVKYGDMPVFKSRSSSYGYYKTKDHAFLGHSVTDGVYWMAGLRTGGCHQVASSHTDGYWHTFYAKDHPEYFAKREDGSRMVGKRGGHLASQRCYSDEGGFQEHLRAIQEYLDTGKGRKKFANNPPNAKYIYWWPNDGFKGCHCKPCMALTDFDGSSRGRHSRLIWTYTAKLARAIKKRWPEKTLMASYYATWSTGPGNIKLPDNVAAMAVDGQEAFLKEPQILKAVMARIDTKTKLNREPGVIWSHYPHAPRIINCLDTPYLAPHKLQEYLRYLRSRAAGVYLNGHYMSSYALDGHVVYLYHKLLWNPELDVDAVLDEYCRLMFGPVAAPIKQYYDTVIKRWETTRWKGLTDAELANPIRGTNWTRYYKETYPRDLRIKLKALLSKAAADAPKETVFGDRASYFAKATDPFFVQGELLDSGTMTKAECGRKSPKIDGKLGDWKGVKPFILKNNANGKGVSVETKVYVAHDAENLYVAFDAAEPGEMKLAPEGSKRDFPLWRYDSVEIFLCTEQPGLLEAGRSIASQYHQFILGPNGNIYDSYKNLDAKDVDAKVTIPIRHIARKTDKGYIIEAAIPYKSLNAIPPKPGAHWLVNFYRNRMRKGSESEGLHAWSPTLASAHNTGRFGKLIFPTPKLWKSDFTKFGKNWRIITPGPHLKVTESVKDGRLILKVKATKKWPSKKSSEFRVGYKPKKRPFVSSKKPMAMQWRYQLSRGTGLVRLRAHVGAMKQELVHTDGRPKLLQGAGWTVGAAKPRKAGPPDKLRHAFFAVKVEPGADFTLEVDYIEVTQKP